MKSQLAMKEFEPQETQQEFFVEFSKEPKKSERFTSISRPQKPFFLSISVEQAILAAIVAILVCCFMFFLGIVRGKSLMLKELRSPVESAPIRLPATVPQQKTQLQRLPVPVTPPDPEPVQKNLRPVTPQVRSDIGKPYTIQLVTYKKKELAEKEVASLKKNGFYSFIIPSGDYYQICVGQYASKEEAVRDIKTLNAKYKDSFLRRR